MREILFRGKRKYSNKKDDWIYGYLTIEPKIADFVIDDSTCTAVPITYETVGQYTGLKDKNGTKIFEGDIVNVKYLDNGEKTNDVIKVAYVDGKGYSPFNWEYDCDGCDCNLEIIDVEVIGNIYDNAELLEA